MEERGVYENLNIFISILLTPKAFLKLEKLPLFLFQCFLGVAL